MQPEVIKQLIEQAIPGVEARVSGDGSHFQADVIGEVFEGKSMLEEQKMVYAAVNEHIASGAIHALTIKAFTPAEWLTASKLNVSGG
jgi:acid stress-induced BolA-like protein IbaG/YrbA